MGILPEDDLLEDSIEENQPIAPSDTWEFDFISGEFTGRRIKGIQSYEQAMTKSIITERDFYEVYGDSYGSELWLLISDAIGSTEYKELISRGMLEDAILYDDRTVALEGYDISIGSDCMHANIQIETVNALELGEPIINLGVSI